MRRLYYFERNTSQPIANQDHPHPARECITNWIKPPTLYPTDMATATNWRNPPTLYPTGKATANTHTPPVHNQLEKAPTPHIPPGMALENKPPVYMQSPRRRRGYTRQQLNAWLDEQERIIRARAPPANEIVEEFDPLYNQPNLHQIYNRDEHVVEQGRRTILFRFDLNLKNSIADQIQHRIVEQVKTRFKLMISTTVELRHIADDKKIFFYETIGTSPWLETLTASQNWVTQQEELRLEHQRRPNTQWVYEKTLMVYVKVILDRQPLSIGFGRLPDWLRNKREVRALDTFRDNLCLIRCIAVHWGAHVRFNLRKTRELAEAFFARRPGLRSRLTDTHIPLLERHFKQGIAVYTVQPNGDFVLTKLPANMTKLEDRL